VDDNPYLNDFYQDMQRWSFNLQIYFLNSRFSQIVKIRQSGKKIIQDRTIYEDSAIFATNLHNQGYMNDRDFANYKALYESMTSIISHPDLMVYLKADIGRLVDNIRSRGRKYEEKIRIEYLVQLQELYDNWIRSYDHGNYIVIDMNYLDFINNPDDFATIVERVDVELNGLFS
jgi:deoxyadenosine/deoxycytidine kinase